MTRQLRRRLAVIGVAAALGVASPAWGPRVLRTVPAFYVSGVEVTGARFVDADAARGLAAIPPEASVWDDHRAAEDRLRMHPLVEDARVRRSGLHGLRIELREVRPVALAPTPELRPVDGKGDVLPLDPAQHALDLPILQGATVESDRVSDEDSRRALAALERLALLNADFANQVSEVRHIPGDAFELILLAGSHVERLLLPVEGTDIAFLRVEDAVRECASRGHVVAADARFKGRVLVQLEGEA